MITSYIKGIKRRNEIPEAILDNLSDEEKKRLQAKLKDFKKESKIKNNIDPMKIALPDVKFPKQAE